MGERVRQQPPNLVIIDEQFAGVSPVDPVKELLKINAMVYVVMVSTMDDKMFQMPRKDSAYLSGCRRLPASGMLIHFWRN